MVGAMDNDSYDAVVVGGGAAGLSGAIALARFGRSVLVIDGGQPRNARADHLHNYLGREGDRPTDLLAAGRKDLESYGGRFRGGEVESVHADGALGFRVVLRDGDTVTAGRILVATGARDELPDIPGVAERFGRDVLHCPFCHGHEVRDQPIGIIASSPLAAHQEGLFRLLSDDVVVFPADRVAALEITDDKLTGVRLDSGEVVPRAAVVVQPTVYARADFLAPLGITPVPVEQDGHLIGTRVETGPRGATEVPGVFVAGNVADPNCQLVTAAATGLAAGAAIVASLVGHS
jgi:thioredoxin reductase